MTERAAHLVDRVVPADVPVRQWVLSVPHRLRYRLAYDHRLCRAVLHVFVRALRSAYRRQARRHGLAGGETGASAGPWAPTSIRRPPSPWARDIPTDATTATSRRWMAAMAGVSSRSGAAWPTIRPPAREAERRRT